MPSLKSIGWIAAIALAVIVLKPRIPFVKDL